MKSGACIGTLSLIACLAVAAADGPASRPSSADIQLLRDRLDLHRCRAEAWGHLTWFDDARRELREADRIYNDMRLLVPGTSKEAIDAALQKADGYEWNVQYDLYFLAARQQARDLAVKSFGLPANVLGHIVIAPYEKADKPLWCVIYTVPPANLKRENVTDPRDYDEHIAGSRSAIATYLAKGQAQDLKGLTFERLREAAVPEGWTPGDIWANENGMLLVQTTNHVATTKITGDPYGAVLLKDGRIVELAEKPFAGPVVVPGSGEFRIDALATDSTFRQLHVLRTTEKGAVIAAYTPDGRFCDERVTFEGKNIVEIAKQTPAVDKPFWTTPYSSKDRKPLDRVQVGVLGFYYGLRYDLTRRRLNVNPVSYAGRYEIQEFVQERQWTVRNTYGNHAIAGVTRTITLDDHGRLVSISESITPA